jgi:hypothetical protein
MSQKMVIKAKVAERSEGCARGARDSGTKPMHPAMGGSQWVEFDLALISRNGFELQVYVQSTRRSSLEGRRRAAD